jgi:hypothetical protein
LQLVPWQLPPDVADSANAMAVRGKLLFADKGETILEVLYVNFQTFVFQLSTNLQ